MHLAELQSKIGPIQEWLLDLIFPPRCIGCGVEGDFLCSQCQNDLPRITSPYCERCGIPYEGIDSCPACLNHPLVIDSIGSPFRHEGIARKAVHRLKYRNLKALAEPLAKLQAEYLKMNPMHIDVIVPVPMHQRRMHRRGYNQAGLLAIQLGLITQTPVMHGWLVRTKNTPSQVSLGAEARRKNIEGAFQCKDQVFRNKNVLIIDDVCTTGATLDACAVTLKGKGAASVWGLTFSRDY